MQKKILHLLFPFPFLMMTSVSFAAEGVIGHYEGIIVTIISLLISNIIPILIMGIFCFFVYRIIVLIKSDSKDRRQEAISNIIFSVIILTVLVSFMGIIFFLREVFIGNKSEDIYEGEFDIINDIKLDFSHLF